MIRVKRNLSRMKSSINFSVKSVTLEKFRFRGSPVTELPWKIRVYTVFHQKFIKYDILKSQMVKSHFLRVKILPKPKIFLPEAEWVFRLCAQKYLGTGPILHMSEFFILDSK